MESHAPILPNEGLHVLHVFYRLNRAAWQAFDGKVRSSHLEQFADLAEEIRAIPETQLLAFSMVGPKADVGFMVLTRDLHVLDEVSKRLSCALGAGVFEPVFSWLSMTERSEYTTSDEEYARQLETDEGIAPGTSAHAEKMEAFRTRMAKYLRDRLEPRLPDWPVFCFYPMSKRRATGQNWYALDFDERKKLMGGHARVGRTYSGRVLQLITGSTGLDDEEWGVSLFAKTPSEIKAIVYEMRFDPVSAHYAEFGQFFIGIQMPAGQLTKRLHL